MEAFFLVGPTASGKTAVAVELAKSGGMEIVSADSMLVYSGMNIGTAKPSSDEQKGVRHWCIDIASPGREFSVGDYRLAALDALRDISGRNRTVMVAGGTGLYIKSLTHGLSVLPKANVKLRLELEDILATKGLAALQNMLHETAPDRFEALDDKANPRRVIRAIELARSGATAPSTGWNNKTSHGTLTGLRINKELLDRRIRHRVACMYDKGLLDEVKQLTATGPLSATATAAIGYAEAIECIKGLITVEEAMERTVVRTRQLAKRQMTWFRGQASVDWIDVDANMSGCDIAAAVKESWRRNGPAEVSE